MLSDESQHHALLRHQIEEMKILTLTSSSRNQNLSRSITLYVPALFYNINISFLHIQCSSRLLSACGASVLLELPPRTPALQRLAAGAVVPALLTGRIDLARL